MVDEEQVQLLLKGRVLVIKWNGACVQESVGGLEVVNHDLLILAGGRDELLSVACALGASLLRPHLKDIDHLANVVSSRFNQVAARCFVQVNVLSFGHFLD